MWMELSPAFVHRELEDCYRVYIVGDDEWHFEIFDRYNGQAYDLVMTANPLVERYHLYQIDAIYYPSVYDSKPVKPPTIAAKSIEVSFVGAIKGKTGRESSMLALARAGIPVTLYGPGTENGTISAAKAVDVYQQSRINLNFTGTTRSPIVPQEAIIDRVRQVKGRCTKIALCGSFVLSEFAPGIDRLFEIGKEIDVFRDSTELIEKTKFYLENDRVREAMAQRAYVRAIEQYDEAKYWSRISSELQQRALAKKRSQRQNLPILLDSAFWSAFACPRFKYLVIFLFRGNLRLFLSELRLLVRIRRFRVRGALWFAAAGLHVARRNSLLASCIAAVARSIRRLGTVKR